MSSGEGNSGVAAASQEVAGTAVDKAAQLSHQTGEQAKAVAGTAVEQARQVGGETLARAGDLLGEAKDQARRQAETQTQRLAESLGRLRDQGRALAAGHPEEAGSLPDVAGQLVSRLDQVAERMGNRGFDGTVNDLQRFARRRPGLFLLGAAATGLAVGRLVRAGAVQHATGREEASEPQHWPGQGTAATGFGYPEPVAVPTIPAPEPAAPPSEVGGL